jgi:predicted nucleic acid-binding Zn ribbon protein
MRYDVQCKACGEQDEIDKPIRAPMPRCECGGELIRLYQPTPVHFRAGGFYTTDVSRLEKQIGRERFAKFERQKDGAEKRARAGRLTEYEKVLESI